MLLESDAGRGKQLSSELVIVGVECDLLFVVKTTRLAVSEASILFDESDA
jgi:hypothetical protein